MISRRRLLFSLGALALLSIATLLLAEVAVQAVVRTGLLYVPVPTDSQGQFWDGRHARFGVWHQPHRQVVHRTECFNASYRTNASGARDRDRTPEAREPRAVVLGDSFVEGWGIPDGQRITDLLEARTGMEHLNFGMSHFGPYQEYLVYEELASRFEHEHVFIGIVPYNDFFDLDHDMARRAPSYEYRYRPYLDGEYPDLVRVDLTEPPATGWLRRHSYAYNAVEYLYYSAREDRGLGPAPPSRDAAGLSHTYFSDFSDRQFDLLRYCLERLKQAAEGKTLVVLLIPTQRDFVRLHQSGQTDLARRLRSLETLGGVVVVDLLAEMYAYPGEWSQYYFPCDYHLNPFGNRIAAEMIRLKLGGIVYDLPAHDPAGH